MSEETVRAILGGDVMLGRLVAEKIKKEGPLYPLGRIAPMLRSADLTIVNLECAITSSTTRWHGAPKAFYFGAPPQAVEGLVDAGVDLVSLANNHSLDMDYLGLLDTLDILKTNGIQYAGAGKNLDEARTPAIVDKKGIKFGMVAYCDHQEDFAATENQPGMAYLDLTDERSAIRHFQEDMERMKSLGVDWPILSLHWGPNMVHRPARALVNLAHKAVELGFRILFGHSAHTFHGVELFEGRPILYAAGDLVDDYFVDEEFKNDHQLLFELEVGRTSLKRARFHSVFIEDCRTLPANQPQREHIAKQMITLSAEMGTVVLKNEGALEVILPEQP